MPGTATAEMETPRLLEKDGTQTATSREETVEPGYLPDENELLEREDPNRAQLLADVRSGKFKYAPGEEAGGNQFGLAAGLGVGAFVLVALFLWLGQRVLNFAGGMKQSLSHGASREVTYTEPDSTPVQPALANSTGGWQTPSSTGRTAALRPSYNGAPMPAPAAGRVGKGPFLGEAQRAAAQQAVRPLHDLVTTVQKFDNTPISLSSTAQGGVAPVVLSGPGGAGGTGVPNPLGGTRGALFAAAAPSGTQVARATDAASVERMTMQTDALSAQVNLATHDELYPPALRPPVRELSRELHAYLMDNQLAATGTNVDSAGLRTAAGKRMARAQAILAYMDNVASGNTDPNATAMP